MIRGLLWRCRGTVDEWRVHSEVTRRLCDGRRDEWGYGVTGVSRRRVAGDEGGDGEQRRLRDV
jgi:hypothetical protein